MLNFGYTNNDIDKILNFPIIVNLKEDSLYKKIVAISNFFLEKGYNNGQIIKMVKMHPKILGLTISNLNKKIDDLIEKGYNLKLIIKITSKCPQIYSLSINNIENKTNKIMEYGYSRDEVLSMISNYPSIYTFDTINMKKKIDELISLGFSYDEAIIITKNFPQIYSFEVSTIREKINFYRYIGLSNLIVSKKKILMQSLELTYARYMYYKSIGIEIDEENSEKLFVSEKVFVNRYKKGRDEIIELYKYDSSKIDCKKRKLVN